MRVTFISSLRFVPALAWMLMIFLFSHQPGGGSGALSKMVLEFLASIGLNLQGWFGEHAVWILRKAAHFTEYCILFFLLFLAFGAWPQLKNRHWLALGGVFLYACTDEFHQLFIPGRVGDFADVLIDTAGGFFGMLIVLLSQRLGPLRS